MSKILVYKGKIISFVPDDIHAIKPYIKFREKDCMIISQILKTNKIH